MGNILMTQVLVADSCLSNIKEAFTESDVSSPVKLKIILVILLMSSRKSSWYQTTSTLNVQNNFPKQINF